MLMFGRAEIHHRRFGRVEVIDIDVQMHLLGDLLSRPSRRRMAFHLLEGDALTTLRPGLSPVVGDVDLPIQHRAVEVRERAWISAVDDEAWESCDSHACTILSIADDRRPDSGELPSRSAAGGAVELFPEDVRMSGVPGGLACHMGHNPPERVALALDRNGDVRFRVADRSDGAIALGHSLLVVPQHIGYGAAGRHSHAVSVSVRAGAEEVVAEPVPLSLRQVLDETNDGSAAIDEHAAQLLIGHAVRLLEYTVAGEGQEGQGSIELA